MVRLSCMDKIARCFFISLASVVLVACGSKSFRAKNAFEQVDDVVYSSVVERERARVLPHLHYSLDVHSIDRRRGTIDLSFYFVKELGDSLLWVEGTERVPLELIDTVLCSRWLNYDYSR